MLDYLEHLSRPWSGEATTGEELVAKKFYGLSMNTGDRNRPRPSLRDSASEPRDTDSGLAVAIGGNRIPTWFAAWPAKAADAGG